MKKFLAAIILFTRLPIWRLISLPQSAYSTAVVYWPLTGWLTGGITALGIYGFSLILPVFPAVISALAIRLLLTGALHEDGLADFFDGFGGGNTKEKILGIMKDSHIGTYGVIALIFYFLLTTSLLASVSGGLAAIIVFVSDPFSKTCASQLINLLNYARPEGAKNKLLYPRMTAAELTLNIISGCLPLLVIGLYSPSIYISAVLPLTTLTVLVRIMKKRIGGYTGDCCGATYLLCELSMTLALIIVARL